MTKNVIKYTNWLMAFLFIAFVFSGIDILPLIVGAVIVYVIIGIVYFIQSKAYKNLLSSKKNKETPYRTLISTNEPLASADNGIFVHDDFLFDGDESDEAYAIVDYGDDEEDYVEEDEVIPDEELEGKTIQAQSESSDEFDKQYRLSKVEKVLSQVDKIPKMGGLEFESFLRDLYDALGYEVHRTDINDQGADLIVRHGNEKIVIQAKRYKNSVSNSAIQQVFTAKHFYDCDKAIVITNSTFTKSAREVAEKVGVELWDKDSLKSMLNSMKSMLKDK